MTYERMKLAPGPPNRASGRPLRLAPLEATALSKGMSGPRFTSQGGVGAAAPVQLMRVPLDGRRRLSEPQGVRDGLL
jgi:hypothetical protein